MSTTGGANSEPLRVPLNDQVGLVPERCEHCDDTGDVTGRDGEWRGYCVCEADAALKAWSKPPCLYEAKVLENYGETMSFGRPHTVHLRLLEPVEAAQ